ncbi:MAG: hypothetical protein GWN81_02360 [Phycisphaerae bacterium]|nr:hypothetical protein [Phycisphaerae bacterium]NIU07713.1 hypothetical protein [Phycisphaerae bacterium]
MESNKFNDRIQLIGIVGVLAGLVFLGYEIQQNTKAVQNESYLNILGMLTEQQTSMTTDEDLSRIIKTGEDTPNELTADEWYRFSQFILPRMGVWEYLYLGSLEGTVPDSLWAAFEPYFMDIVCKPGYERWLSEFGTQFAPQFIEYLNSTALPECTR